MDVDLAQYVQAKQEEPIDSDDDFMFIPIKGQYQVVKIDLRGLADIHIQFF